MSSPKNHSEETKKLLEKIPKDIIAKWLLEEGYYPEQYVLPPPFKVHKFKLQTNPYFLVQTNDQNRQKFNPTLSALVNISFPKSELTDRTFGIIEPKIYHDIVWYLINEWNLIIEILFNPCNKIYSYSFPIPVTKNNEGFIGNLRTGRMIYEFLEMAENDLLTEAFNYKYILKTDIKNFYSSIYTHSIAWALHSKEIIRQKGNRENYSDFLGLKLDKLFQSANDGCTNGIAVGPAISDLISEIILSSVDTIISKNINLKDIDFIGVRFKDDYRFLCQSKEDANKIIKILQKELALFNLTLNESKSKIDELPDGLFRDWTLDYQNFELKYKNTINYKKFENSFRGTLKIDKKFEGIGVVDRFLSELTTEENKLKFNFKDKDFLKAISLLLLLVKRRKKSLPQILGIIEKIILDNDGNTLIITNIKSIFEKLLKEKLKAIEDHQYDLVWIIYFVKSMDLFPIILDKTFESKIISSIQSNSFKIYESITSDILLFKKIKKPGENIDLLSHLAIFKKTNE